MRGFSKIELIIIAAFLIGLFAIILQIKNPFLEAMTSRDNKRKAELLLIKNALENFYQINKIYPKSDQEFRIVRLNGTSAIFGEEWMPFLRNLPKDPNFPERTYVYFVKSLDRQSYFLYASLESKEDSERCKKDNSICDNAPRLPDGESACGGVCNYGVSSNNVTP